MTCDKLRWGGREGGGNVVRAAGGFKNHLLDAKSSVMLLAVFFLFALVSRAGEKFLILGTEFLSRETSLRRN